MPSFESDHWRIIADGWSYRSNDRGWIIYRHPQTGRWHTHAEAIAIVEPEMGSIEKEARAAA
jgi:hypothetical protein